MATVPPARPRALCRFRAGRLFETLATPIHAVRRIAMSMEGTLSREFLRVVEVAAIECARTMGRGDRRHSDHVATEAMRQTMDEVAMRGTIVIGEGERDEAPMLYIGEKVGRGGDDDPEVDIAVDPLEGTNLCATGEPNAIAVLAASNKGGLLHAPDCYMEKIIVGPAAKGAVHLDAPPAENLKAIAKRLNRQVQDLVVIVLDRPRHEKLIDDIRTAGARIRLISDGDLSAGISAAVRGTNVHAVMGTGGAPEGVLAAAAVRCLNGGMQGRLVKTKEGQEERMRQMGITDPKRIFTERDLAPGPHIIFAAAGVTDGSFMRGVRFFGHGSRTSSLLMSLTDHLIRFVDTVHLDGTPDVVVEF
jgi:fructose-1,6-bisphosphatase II / sedoheptulose-1,7-bisphosphatase